MRSTLAAKLRVTAAVLGCATRKDLCARFRAANPGTEFDLERSHKWMQGRAAPRSSRVYDDWALVIGTRRPGAWVASCSVDAFIEEVAALCGADPALLRQTAEQATRRLRSTARQAGGKASEPMAFACYSPAWSPYFRGRLFRGSLLIEGPGGGERRLIYREQVAGEEFAFEGVAEGDGRIMSALLRARHDAPPLHFCLYQPGSLASALAGIVTGATYLAQEVRPTASRFAAVRVPPGAALDAGNGYFDPRQGAVAEDLIALGLPEEAASEAAAGVMALLDRGGGIDQVEFCEQTRIAEAIDRGWIRRRLPQGGTE